MFLRTITSLDDNEICKKILVGRTHRYLEDAETNKLNDCNSPVFEILNAAKDVGLYDICINIITNGHFYPFFYGKRLGTPSEYRSCPI